MYHCFLLYLHFFLCFFTLLRNTCICPILNVAIIIIRSSKPNYYAFKLKKEETEEVRKSFCSFLGEAYSSIRGIDSRQPSSPAL